MSVHYLSSQECKRRFAGYITYVMIVSSDLDARSQQYELFPLNSPLNSDTLIPGCRNTPNRLYSSAFHTRYYH